MQERRQIDLSRRIASIARYRDLAGATVLEIGADFWSHAAKMLIDAGAAKVISSNFAPNWPDEENGPIQKRKIDARRLSEYLPAESVDVVFGVAVLEHINGLPEFFSQARRVLKPGGLFFVHGGPLWSFAKGHHVFANGTKKYRFSDPKTNPIPNWAHLVSTKETLIDRLLRDGIPTDDARMIGEWVYDLDGINRVGYRSMCEAFDASPLQLMERLEVAFAKPTDEMVAAIEAGPYGGQKRYDVSGVTFVARP